jgi:hypothetical protein
MTGFVRATPGDEKSSDVAGDFAVKDNMWLSGYKTAP